jgi:hypothetical protein
VTYRVRKRGINRSLNTERGKIKEREREGERESEKREGEGHSWVIVEKQCI